MSRGAYILTNHLCRECLGRILQRIDGEGAGLHRCSNCGAEASGEVESICACGMRLSDQTDLRFRCMRNPKRSPKFPAEVVVRRVDLGGEGDDNILQSALPLRDYAT